MKSLSEFRINIERDSWSRVLVLARDDAGILRILCVNVKGFERSCFNVLTF